MLEPQAALAIVGGILAKADPALTAHYVHAADESEDDQIDVKRCGEPTPVSIQVCLYGDYATNRYFYNGNGQINAMQMLYMGNNLRTAAQKAAAAA
jgi:hypothetical protein